MQIDKAQILELLEKKGDHGQVQQADEELPNQVDTDQHAGLLEKYGIDIKDLIGGGGGLGGLLS